MTGNKRQKKFFSSALKNGRQNNVRSGLTASTRHKAGGVTSTPFHGVRPLRKISQVTDHSIMKHQTSGKVGGFTMVELLTSVGLFMVVVTASTSLFLAIVQGNRKAVAIQNIVDEGRFVLEIMSRDIRTGTGFPDCTGAPGCPTGPKEFSALQFTDAANNNVCYRFNATEKSIEKVTPGCGGTVTQVTSSHIQVDHSKFLVNGTIPGDNVQPRITILIGISSRGSKAESVSTIDLQTTVSQRVIDF